MKNNTIFGLLFAALAIPAIVVPSTVYGGWSGDIEGGTVVQGDGNGSLIRFKMSNSERPLNQQFYADWIRSNAGNSYKVGYEPQYWFSDRYEPQYWFSDLTYVFGDASLLTSKDSNIDQQSNLFAGVGIQLINTQTTNFFAEVGAGKTSTKFDAETLRAKQDVDSTVARVGASQVLTDFFRLELDGDYTTSDVVDRTTAEAGLSFKVPGGAIKYTYRVRNEEVDGLPSVDTSDSFVSFNYGF